MDTPVADAAASGDPADAAAPAGPDPDRRGAGGGGCAANGAGTGAVAWLPPAAALGFLRRRRAAAFLGRGRVASVLPLVFAAGCAATGAIRGPWPQVTSWPGDDWPSSPPEAQGMDPRPLAEAIESALADDLPIHGILVVRHGAVVLDASFHPFGPRDRHDVASVTKSVTGTLVGIAIGRGDLPGLDARLLDILPEHVAAAAPDTRKAATTLRDLLTMRSGLDCHPAPGSDLPLLLRMIGSPDWAAFSLDVPLSEAPGKAFRYCSLASHLLAVVLRRATGRSALDYAREHLFGPLGIRSADWPADPRTGDPHGWGDLALDRYDMARLGYLYLAGGRWQGRQVVPAEWVRASLSRQAAIEPFGPIDGYGYHWWTSTRGFGVAMGRGGQWVVVVPGLDLVVVLTSSGTGEVTARKADLVQRLVLGAVRGPGPIPDDPSGRARLAAAVARAATARDPAPGPAPALPPSAAAVSGAAWDLADNAYGLRSATLRFGPPGEAVLDLVQRGFPPLAIRIGLDGAWRTFPGRRGYPARARGAWDDGTSFRIELDELALVNRWTLVLRFDGDRVAVRIEDASGNPPAAVDGVRRPAVAQ
ncbi:MAG: serine hydrolase [Deltaproteobacteria bacterium]|nr:serine hydrolase [Deltaproteobacteria bacterium]